jgi:hypothetical protein
VTLLLVIAAADWVAGSTWLVSTWRARGAISLRRRRLDGPLSPHSPTPFADEVEEWLRDQ